MLQFELDEYDKENSALNVRVRQTKTNFGPKIEPIGVRFTFGEKKVEICAFELPDEELIEEESKPVKERIVGALSIGPATNADLQKLTGASPGTIRNNLSHLIQEGRVVEDGYQGRSKVYCLLSSSPTPPRGNDSDDISITVERALEALHDGNAPRKALENYREGAQDFESVVKSVLYFWGQDIGHWNLESATSVLSALSILDEEASGEG